MNTLSAKLGGLFQNASTIMKLVPLVLISIAGLIFGDTSNISLSDITAMKSTGWIAAIAPIAFSFDGWIVSTSISHEIKDSKRNLKKLLTKQKRCDKILNVAAENSNNMNLENERLNSV